MATQTPGQARLRSTRTPSLHDNSWCTHRSTIEDLYIQQRMTLRQVMKYMRQKYGFQPSTHMYKRQIRIWGWRKNKLATRAQQRRSENLVLTIPALPNTNSSKDVVNTFDEVSPCHLEGSYSDKPIPDILEPRRGEELGHEHDLFVDQAENATLAGRAATETDTMETGQITNEDRTTTSGGAQTPPSATFRRSFSSLSSVDDLFTSTSAQVGSWSQKKSTTDAFGSEDFLQDLQADCNRAHSYILHCRSGQAEPVRDSHVATSTVRPIVATRNGTACIHTNAAHDLTPESLLLVEESRWSTGNATPEDIAQLEQLADLYSALGRHHHAFLLSRRILMLYERHQGSDYTSLAISSNISRMVVSAVDNLDLQEVASFVRYALGQRAEFYLATTPQMCLLQSHLGVLINDEKDHGARERHCSKAVARYKTLMNPEKLDFRFLAVRKNLARVEYQPDNKQDMSPTSRRDQLAVTAAEWYTVSRYLSDLLDWCLAILSDDGFWQMFSDFSEELWTDDLPTNALADMEQHIVFSYLYQQWKYETSLSPGAGLFYIASEHIWSLQQDHHLQPHDTIMALACMIVGSTEKGLRQRQTLTRRVLFRLREITCQCCSDVPTTQMSCRQCQRLMTDFVDAHLQCLNRYSRSLPKGEHALLFGGVLLDFINRTHILSMSDTIFRDSPICQMARPSHATTNIAYATLATSRPASSMRSIRRWSSLNELGPIGVADTDNSQLPGSQESFSTFASVSMSLPNANIEDRHPQFSYLSPDTKLDEDEDENNDVGTSIDAAADDIAMLI